MARLLLLGSFKKAAALTTAEAEAEEAKMEAWCAGGGQMGSCIESTALAAEMEPIVDGR